jgi:hypothetical protein
MEIRDDDVKADVFLQCFKLEPFISKSDFGPAKVFFPVLCHNIFGNGKCCQEKKKEEGKTK